MDNKEIDFCMICKKKFDDVVLSSKEHIIPEALGNTKLVTCGVCKKCNNDLGSIIDSYLGNNIISKLLRISELKKDKNIKLFNAPLQDSNGIKYLIKNGKPELIPNIDIKENKDNIVNIKATFSSEKECKDIVTKKIRRELKFLSEQDIKNILNNSISITPEKNSSIELKYDEEINLGKIYLAIIKIAYEYAVEKLGISYIENNFAEKIRNYLYKAITTKTDINYDFCSKVCSVVDFNFFDYKNIIEKFNNIVSLENVGLSKIRHFINLINKNGKLFCIVRLFNKDFLTFKILLSDNMVFQSDKKYFITFITEDNDKVDF